jgi:hypothetical protein
MTVEDITVQGWPSSHGIRSSEGIPRHCLDVLWTLHIPRRSSSTTKISSTSFTGVRKDSMSHCTPRCAISPLQAPALSKPERIQQSGDNYIEKGQFDFLNRYSRRSLFFSIFQMKTISGQLIQRSGLWKRSFEKKNETATDIDIVLGYFRRCFSEKPF